MSVAKELIQYENYNLSDLVDILDREGFDIAYSSTYSLQEIRKAIRANQPSFVRMGNGLVGHTIYIVGENEHSLVAYKNGDMYNIPDESMMKAWTGEAVIVLDKKGDSNHLAKAAEISEEKKETCDFVIFNPIRDNWDTEQESQKAIGKRQITRVNQMDLCELPAHPVIVIFCKPSEDFQKKGIRAANGGAEIQIYDPTDPFTEFLHELGHFYWRTRLNDDEKNIFVELHGKLDQKNRPAIFMAQWDSNDGEEIFCTVYYWYCKGKISHDGYTKILAQQYPEGYGVLTAIINRVRDEMDNQATMKAKIDTDERLWKAREREIAVWMNHIQSKPNLTLVKGKGYIKTKIKVPDIINYDFPETIPHTKLGEYKDRSWCMINSGILKNRVIVVKAGKLDVPYMKFKKNFHLVPRTRYMQKGNKTYRRTVYVSPDTILKAQTEKPEKPVIDVIPVNQEKRNLWQVAKTIIEKIK